MGFQCCLPFSSSSSPILFTHQCLSHSHHSSSLSHPFGTGYPKSPTSLSICCATSPNPNSTPTPTPTTSDVDPPPIFLSSLQDYEKQEEIPNPPIEQKVEQGPDSNSINDPMLKFFQSRSSSQTPDAPLTSKLSLQKNRRTSWRLSPTITDAKDETAILHFQNHLKPETQPQLGSQTEGIVGAILELARNSPENFMLGDLLRPYEGKVGKSECIRVLDLMGKEGRTMDCLQFFEWMGLQEPSLVTPWAYRILFPVLGRAAMGDKLMVLFRNIANVGQFSKDVDVYNAALSGLLSCGRYDDAWKVYEKLETDNIQPDDKTCSIMITIMRRMGNSAKDAWEFFTKMDRKGVKWSVEVMGGLIKAFCDEGLKKQALIIQVEMEKKGIPSNVIVYNTLMDAYSKSNQVEEAEGLFAEMKGKGIAPTTASYTILMDAYSRRMQPEIIEELMLEMENLGLKPDVKSFTCLISAYGRQRKMSDMAANAFLKMKKVGIKPTSHSYTALIHAYAVDGWHEKAYITFENMQRERIKPSIETYTALLDACRRAGDTKALMKIWKMMIIDKVEGTRVTFNILVDGFAKNGYYMEARDVISEFGKIGYQPTVMTYNMLMNAYARGGQESKLPQLLKEMAALNLKPDSFTYCTMIYAYVRVRDFKRAFFYHKQMVKSGQVPDPKSYEKLRAILDVKAATKNKKDKSAILGIINSKLGQVKVKKKAKKDEFWKTKKSRPRTRGPDSVGRR